MQQSYLNTLALQLYMGLKLPNLSRRMPTQLDHLAVGGALTFD